MFNLHKTIKPSCHFLCRICAVKPVRFSDAGLPDAGGCPLPGQPQPTASELNGLHIYISEGCVACHTQQVRNIEMDKMWGDWPSIPSGLLL